MNRLLLYIFSLIFLFPHLLFAGDKNVFNQPLNVYLNPAQFFGVLNSQSNSTDKIVANPDALRASLIGDWTLQSNCKRALEGKGSLEERLSGCQILYNRILWETAGSHLLSYEDWSGEMKDRLNTIFELLLRGDSNLGLTCVSSAESARRGGYYHQNEAFDVFAAHLAHVFYVESQQLVSWSIFDFPSAEWSHLLDSRVYFSTIAETGRTDVASGWSEFLPGRDYQRPPGAPRKNTDCDPRIGFEFLNGRNAGHNRFISDTPQDTLSLINRWAKENVFHGGEYADYSLQGRLTSSSNRLIPAPVGCHDVAYLIHDLAKSVNIPLLYLQTHIPGFDTYERLGVRTSFVEAAHGGLAYAWSRPEAKVLFHADWLYAQNDTAYFPVSAEGIRPDNIQQWLFDESWFSISQLQARGIEIAEGFPQVNNGEGLGRFNVLRSGVVENYNRFGNYGGSVRLVSQDPQNSADIQPQWIRYLLLEQKANLCSWEGFLDLFCSENDLFTAQMGINASLLGTSALDSSFRYNTAYDLYNRATTCVNFMGGCSVLQRSVAAYNSRLVQSWQ